MSDFVLSNPIDNDIFLEEKVGNKSVSNNDDSDVIFMLCLTEVKKMYNTCNNAIVGVYYKKFTNTAVRHTLALLSYRKNTT